MDANKVLTQEDIMMFDKDKTYPVVFTGTGKEPYAEKSDDKTGLFFYDDEWVLANNIQDWLLNDDFNNIPDDILDAYKYGCSCVRSNKPWFDSFGEIRLAKQKVIW